MKLDLFKLINLGRLEIDTDLVIPEEYFGTLDIRKINNLHVSGIIRVEMDEVFANLDINGEFVLPCAITLEDVITPFSTHLEDSLGNLDDIYEKNKQTFDILPILWGDIAANIPIRVVKEGARTSSLKGDGWEFVSSD